MQLKYDTNAVLKSSIRAKSMEQRPTTSMKNSVITDSASWHHGIMASWHHVNTQ